MAHHTALSLSCALLFSCAAGMAQPSSSQHVVPLKLYGQHLIVVQGSIGSFEKRNLVIDTGAYPSIIDRGLAKKLHLSGPDERLDAVDPHTDTSSRGCSLRRCRADSCGQTTQPGGRSIRCV